MAYDVRSTLRFSWAVKDSIAVRCIAHTVPSKICGTNSRKHNVRVGRVAEETHRVCNVAKVAIAKAKSVHGAVESRVASLMAQAEASTVHIVGVLSECVQEVAAHLEEQASPVADVVSQQLEKDSK